MTFRFMKRLRAAAVVGLAAACGVAHSQATPPPAAAQSSPPLLPDPAPPLSAREFAVPPMSDSFADLDRDKDGIVTPEESARDRQVAMAFERLDENGDGRLDLAEYAQLKSPLRKR